MPLTRAGDVTLAYQRTGEGRPLVLLPGFAADRTFWAGVVPLLPGRTVLVPDPRGAGGSDAPAGDYDVATLADDVLAVLADARAEGPVDVVGHSLGGAIAQQLAHRSPERVRRLVLLQSFARAGVTCRRALRGAAQAYDHDDSPMAELARTLFPWLFSAEFLADDETYESLVALSVSSPTPQPRSGCLGQLAALDAFDSRGWLVELRVPTLVVAAEHDLLVPAADSRALAAALPAADLVTIGGAGHCAPVERPAMVASLVRAFVSD